ncbi:MAG: hypothetical protein RLN62_04730 [Rickettsiales bacterium]
MKFRSYAKINLFLHITGKYGNNFHKLESLVAFCKDLYDEISIEPSAKNQFHCSGDGIEYISTTNNIFSKTLNILYKNNETQNYKITVKKNIPIGAGLGGGSSNAAAFVKQLIKTKDIVAGPDLIKTLNQIGSDVPVCYYNKISYFKSDGSLIFPAKINFTPYAILLFPKLHTSTKRIFDMGFKNLSSAQPIKYNFENYEELVNNLQRKRNDLYENTKLDSPIIEYLVKLLQSQNGCDLARMTGSGSAIFGLFKTKKLAINAYNNLKQNKDIFIAMTGLN